MLPETPHQKKSTTILQVFVSHILIVDNRTSLHGIVTRRKPITFEDEDERKEPKKLQWENAQAVEDGNSEGNNRTMTVVL